MNFKFRKYLSLLYLKCLPHLSLRLFSCLIEFESELKIGLRKKRESEVGDRWES